MSYTIYELFCFFVIYAVLGWCVEVIYATVNSGKFVNRGFLNGPVCPIYGFGVVIVIVALTPLQDNLAFLFVGSVLLTSVLEFLTGFVLEKVFHDKWWDYSGDPFNIRGYVCLKFSLLWGLACVFVMRIVQPLFVKLVHWMPETFGVAVLAVCGVLFLADGIVTITTIHSLKKRLRLMEEIGQRLRQFSDKVGGNLSDGVMDVMEKSRKGKGELEELRKKYQALSEEKKFGHKRLLNAFPHLQNGKHRDLIANWKKRGKQSANSDSD